MTKVAKSEWYPGKKLIITQLSGDIKEADVVLWEKSLQDTLAQIGDHGSFKIFINLHGFTATDFATHKQFRGIIPETLARYGWKVGYVDLFVEAAKMRYTNTRGITCVAAAHTHQDALKIDAYEQRFGRENEHFFTDPQKAYEWIDSVDL
ncbi:hypothetical protein [Spirosoma endbachense]|uniref:STAS/SEC14 domain-containing protein n=1 Tax=Spirosoma endbachense TaxID=2666025 RepID=A0A6P1VPX6_9BACT|nr:hypothetical protein [Spirosoma endbachense]QHV93659.1 hypothetical protein GJR95_00800 [Spirosoma endbachense]